MKFNKGLKSEKKDNLHEEISPKNRIPKQYIMCLARYCRWKIRMSNDEINRVIEDHINYILEGFYKRPNRRFKKDYSIKEPPKMIERATELNETGILKKFCM